MTAAPPTAADMRQALANPAQTPYDQAVAILNGLVAQFAGMIAQQFDAHGITAAEKELFTQVNDCLEFAVLALQKLEAI